MRLVDNMNRAIEGDEALLVFMYKLHIAVMRTGKPIPRRLCVAAGMSKPELERFVRRGWLVERRARIGDTRSEYVGYTLAENVTFYGNRLVEVMPAKDALDALQQKGLESTIGDDSIVAQGIEGAEDAASHGDSKDIARTGELPEQTRA